MRLLAIRDYRREEFGIVGVIGVLGVVFVVLKLARVVGWSWWWVTAPFWGFGALIVVAALVAGLAALIATIFVRRR